MIAHYDIKQVIHDNSFYLLKYLETAQYGDTFKLQLCGNYFISLVRDDDYQISIHQEFPEVSVKIGTIAVSYGAESQIRRLGYLIGRYMFDRTLEQLGISKYKDSEYLFTEADYVKLHELLGKDVIPTLKSKHWNWCTNLVDQLEEKYVEGITLEMVEVKLF